MKDEINRLNKNTEEKKIVNFNNPKTTKAPYLKFSLSLEYGLSQKDKLKIFGLGDENNIRVTYEIGK